MQFPQSSNPPDRFDDVDEARVLDETECKSDGEEDREDDDGEWGFLPVGRGRAGNGRDKRDLLRGSRSAKTVKDELDAVEDTGVRWFGGGYASGSNMLRSRSLPLLFPFMKGEEGGSNRG